MSIGFFFFCPCGLGDHEALLRPTCAHVAGSHDAHGAQVRTSRERHLRRPLKEADGVNAVEFCRTEQRKHRGVGVAVAVHVAYYDSTFSFDTASLYSAMI